MAFRRKRRARVVWLPQSIEDRFTGGASITNGSQNGISDYRFVYNGGVGNRTDFVTPLIRDSQASPAIVNGLTTLSDLYNSAYRLRRIVGQLFAAHDQTAVGAGPFPDVPTGCLFGIGFITLRVDPETQEPIDPVANVYSLFSLDNTSDPWIWRRSWLLADRNLWVANGNGGNIGAFLASNIEYGDVRSGPHVDAKTARVVSLEERVFMVFSAIAFDGIDGATNTVRVNGDLRFLASMRSSIGNRGNTSR